MTLAGGLALVGILIASEGYAQTAAIPAHFEVASIKPSVGCDGPWRPSRGLHPAPGRLDGECITLEGFIQNAYGNFANPSKPNAKRVRLSGGPAWVTSEGYSVSAKAKGNLPTSQMMGPMLRTLLEERFALKIRREAREGSVYELTTAKGGLKLKPTPTGSCVSYDPNLMPQNSPQVPATGTPCGVQQMSSNATKVSLTSLGPTMADLAVFLSNMTHSEVIDKTGLPEMFDVHLEYARDNLLAAPEGSGDPGAAAVAGAPSDEPSLFKALEEQLGLKLTPSKGPIEFLVIDHVERPTEN